MHLEKAIKKFPAKRLLPEEQILLALDGWAGYAMGRGKRRQITGILVVTNRRVIFFKKGLFSTHFQAIPFHRITSVESVRRLGIFGITVYAAGDELHFGGTWQVDAFNEIVDILTGQLFLAAA